MAVTVHRTLDELPASFDPLFAEGASDCFYLTKGWFRTLIDTTLEDAAELRIYAVSAGFQAPGDGLFVMRRQPPAPLTQRTTLCSLSNFYTMVFAPVLRASADSSHVVGEVFDAIAAEKPALDVVHLRALDHESPLFALIGAALEQSGFWIQPYFHFGNRYESVRNDTITSYMNRRPSVLRNTIRRKEKKIRKEFNIAYAYTNDDSGLGRKIEDYEKIHAKSWKPAEPFPLFMPELMRCAAACGALRLGFALIDGTPVATQLWLVWNRRATIYKLSHDKDVDHLSIGSLLTRFMVEKVLEENNLDEIDFGAGDDPYKALWMSQRRERWGIIAFNRRTMLGRLEAARQFGARGVRSLARRFAP